MAHAGRHYGNNPERKRCQCILQFSFPASLYGIGLWCLTSSLLSHWAYVQQRRAAGQGAGRYYLHPVAFECLSHGNPEYARPFRSLYLWVDYAGGREVPACDDREGRGCVT